MWILAASRRNRARTHDRVLLKVRCNETGNVRDTEVRARKSCCPGKAVSVTYSECVFVALFIQHI
jgi:hypothetical protein